MGTLVDNGGCYFNGEITVSEMSKKDREARGIVTDVAKFSDAQRKKVVIVLSKNQGSFLLK